MIHKKQQTKYYSTHKRLIIGELQKLSQTLSSGSSVNHKLNKQLRRKSIIDIIVFFYFLCELSLTTEVKRFTLSSAEAEFITQMAPWAKIKMFKFSFK